MSHELTWVESLFGSPEGEREFEREQLVQSVTSALHNAFVDVGLTQAEVAARLGKTPAYVSQILSGRRNCTLHTVADLAWAAGVRVNVDLGYLQPLVQPDTRQDSQMVSNRRRSFSPAVPASTDAAELPSLNEELAA
jgi:transcriptional regulator with XRE-family HTH domain